MAKKEALQEELTLTRSIFLTCLVSLFSVYGYFTINYEKIQLDNTTMGLGAFGIFVLIALMILCGISWKKSKDLLEKEH